MRELAIRLIRPHISVVRDTVKLQAVADLERERALCGGVGVPTAQEGQLGCPFSVKPLV